MSNDNFKDMNFMENLDFRNHAVSADLYDDLQNTDIDIYLKQNKKNMIPHNLPIHLDLLLKQKGLTKADVGRRARLDRKYVYQIFSGEKHLQEIS